MAKKKIARRRRNEKIKCSRIEKFRRWVMARPEKKIAVVSHSSFLGQMMYGEDRK